MPSEPAIEARGLGKSYRLFSRRGDRLKQLFTGNRRKYYRDFWALRHFDLEVHRGETVGIVGRNGSGKSTLLQLVCGTLTPTEGELTVNGRVAALLELGAGFNPEFTGRENVHMNAAILGLDDEEIDRRFDSIAAFADIGEFLEQPVKSYSSGMYARLAFSVAINVDPEILVVDEALSVGDEAFQRRCFGRIHEITESGATVLFVSHSNAVILELCDRALLLDQGQVLLVGDPKPVVYGYQNLIYAPPAKAAEIREKILKGRLFEDAAVPKVSEQPSTPDGAEGAVARYDPEFLTRSAIGEVLRGAEICNPRVEDLEGRRVNVLVSGDRYRIVFDVSFKEPAFRVRFGVHIKTIIGSPLGGAISHPMYDGVQFVESGETLTATFDFVAMLCPNTYFVDLSVQGLGDGREDTLHLVGDAIMFRIDPVEHVPATGFVKFFPDSTFRLSHRGKDRS